MIIEDINKTVSRFISKTFLFDPDKEINATASLLGTGVIDSTGVLELISFLETNYKIRFEDEELIAENFDSIDKIASFMMKKLDHTA